MSPARFRWGSILIQLGILVLLANLDVINYNWLFEAVVFIAVLLIFVGIEKIFTKSRFQFISYLTSIGILVVGFAIAYNSSVGGSSTSFWSETTYQLEFDPGVERINAVLNCNDVGLTIRDVGEDLLYGRFDEFTNKPMTDYRLEDGIAYIKMSRRSGSFLDGAIKIDTDQPRDWYLRFSDRVPINLECYGDDSDVHLNLSTSRLDGLKLAADNAKMYVKLGVLVPRVHVTISGDDSSLKLRVPEEAGIKIVGEDYRSYLVDQLGMVEDENGVFVNEGFDSLSTQIEVDLDYRLKSFILDYF